MTSLPKYSNPYHIIYTDDCGCLEMDETEIPQRLSDEQARDLLEQICGCRDSGGQRNLSLMTR